MTLSFFLWDRSFDFWVFEFLDMGWFDLITCSCNVRNYPRSFRLHHQQSWNHLSIQNQAFYQQLWSPWVSCWSCFQFSASYGRTIWRNWTRKIIKDWVRFCFFPFLLPYLVYIHSQIIGYLTSAKLREQALDVDMRDAWKYKENKAGGKTVKLE